MSGDFFTQLVTGILSCPIIYIPHFHFGFVDDVINRLVEPIQGGSSLLGLTKDSIMEFCAAQGIVFFDSKDVNTKRDSYAELETLLKRVVDGKFFKKEKIFLFKNLHESMGEVKVQALLQTFAEKYEQNKYDPLITIIIVSAAPVAMLPGEVVDLLSVIEVPAPSNKELEEYVKKFSVSGQYTLKAEAIRADLCRTLQGLQWYDVHQIMRSVLCRTGEKLTSKTVNLALEEKKRIVKKSGIIEVVDSDVSFNDIGGLDLIRKDMETKQYIFNNLTLANSQRINLVIPRGILIVGMPGCGKSMIVKAIANLFGVSLLRLDISSLMGKFVGQSEENLRRALYTAEAAHPCVLWIDEIEKAFHGGNNADGDGSDNTVMRMMSYFLTWMQERKSAVYIVATANDALRPEFMRKGRFDEVYFVNFPNEQERRDIFSKKIHRFKNSNQHSTIFDFTKLTSIDDIIREMDGFAGAEIECVVNVVMEKKFVEYVKRIEEEHKVDTLSVVAEDFLKVIKDIKGSIMSKQRSGSGNEEKTPIEKILEMNNIYNFRPASSKN